MILHNLKQISSACPTQWLATNEQGQRVYIRYRWDTLTVHCPFDEENDDYETFMAAQILKMIDVTGNDWRGAMDDDEMLELTGYTLGEEQHP